MRRFALLFTLHVVFNPALPSHSGDLSKIELVLNNAADRCLSERTALSDTYYFGNRDLIIKTSPESDLLKGKAIEEFCTESALSRPPMEITVQPFDLLVQAEINKVLFENGKKNDAALGGLGNVIAALTYAQETIKHGSFGCSALENFSLGIAYAQGESLIGELSSEDMRTYSVKANMDLINLLLSERWGVNTCQ
ncbi:hypothetical protein [Paracoccus jiaweipingae]|uniref:hypothetical protein n=1 Tax=Paracoccus sp. p2-l61 TaxID=3366950 RepID=UPI0037AE4981